MKMKVKVSNYATIHIICDTCKHSDVDEDSNDAYNLYCWKQRKWIMSLDKLRLEDGERCKFYESNNGS
jgi:hypothetical protein